LKYTRTASANSKYFEKFKTGKKTQQFYSEVHNKQNVDVAYVMYYLLDRVVYVT